MAGLEPVQTIGQTVMVSMASFFGLKTRVGVSVFVTKSLRAAPKLVVSQVYSVTDIAQPHIRHRFELTSRKEPELSSRAGYRGALSCGQGRRR